MSMPVQTLHRATERDYRDENPSHLIGIDGMVYCIPLLNIDCSSPCELSWNWYSALRGKTVWNFIRWFLGSEATSYEWEVMNHFEWGQEKICHTWQGVEYKYHGS